MTVEFRSKSHRIASTGVAYRGSQPRSLGAILTGGAVALALILGAAMPAKAEKKDDLAKAILGALVIGVIVNELHDKPGHGHQPVKSPKVPEVCAISIQGSDRSVTLFPESCLRREKFDYQLPRTCGNPARIFGRADRVYSAQCLRDAGFRVTGR